MILEPYCQEFNSPLAQLTLCYKHLVTSWKKTNKPPTEGGYRRLRIFSGTQPVPASEEQFDHWLEQAWLMVEESECTEKEKRRRLLESLKGPALEIVRAVRTSNHDAEAKTYLEALESAFGTAESGDDLYFAFRLLQQQPGEKLSDFLRRMERALSKVVQRGGLSHTEMDRARVERKANPPTFLQLLSEIRAEEGYEASRMKLNTTVSQLQIKHSPDSKQGEIQSLKAEIKDLKSMVTSVALPSAERQKDCPESTLLVTSQLGEKSHDSELRALKKQVKRLQTKLDRKMVTEAGGYHPATVFTVEAPTQVVHTPSRSFRPSESQFCYRCGENGHFAARCPNQENHSRVIKKLVQALKLSKEKLSSTNTPETQTHCAVKRSVVTATGNAGIPDGLVGPPSTVQLKVNGNRCTALFDSGSQVTIIFESWYQKHLSDVKLHPVAGLALWGLSESEESYPYRGYVVVDLEYPPEITGTCRTVTVLALICPSPRTTQETPVIVGTNTSHVRSLVKQCRDSGLDITQTLGIQTGWVGDITADDSGFLSKDEDDKVGVVTWQGPGPLTLHPGEDQQINCKVDFNKSVVKEILMVDSSPSASLPGSLLLQPMVVPASAVKVNNFRVLVHTSHSKIQ
ncbi:uncharacterized protein LOC114842218 [Betta splendens]|uniref:Uncharacterized protein LOC114842218 n=1 Tax=Betta splendens TaxID=158456 RepID=A0A6P7KQA6_BETSP|nr:uncharacterized protein LOC114842218 [Betta splendens]